MSKQINDFVYETIQKWIQEAYFHPHALWYTAPSTDGHINYKLSISKTGSAVIWHISVLAECIFWYLWKQNKSISDIPYTPIEPVPSIMAVTVDNALELPRRLSCVPCWGNSQIDKSELQSAPTGFPWWFSSYQVSRYSSGDEGVRPIYKTSTQQQHTCMREQTVTEKQTEMKMNTVSRRLNQLQTLVST